MSIPLALTAGDPAGVGPELLVRLLDELRSAPEEPVVIVSSAEELRQGLDRSALDIELDDLLATPHFTLDELDAHRPDDVGVLSAEAGAWALAGLTRSLQLQADGAVGGFQFGPLNKASLHLAGMAEPDEMRWFENRIGGELSVSEVNVTTTFWTARVTSHIPLREVSAGITETTVCETTVLLDKLLKQSGIAAPRIAVCALNPHAGENGLFGDEEIVSITPGVARAAERGVDVAGPFPCDTLFRRGFDGTYDGIVTMYHDQGQIALKTHAFDGGVTLEAGLGVPICTPAHGTAFDIVGTGKASLDSTRNAYRLARRLVQGAA